MAGFVDSQTWEAWFESYEVLWDNTSYMFVISVILSVVIAVATYLMPMGSREVHQSDTNKDDHSSEEKCEQDTDGSEASSKELPRGQLKHTPRKDLERELENQMTIEQRDAEREAQSEQLAAIFKMMQEQEEKFGKTSIDDIKDQMKLYCG